MSKLKTAGKFGGGLCVVAGIIGIMYANFGGEIRLSPQGAEIIGNAEGYVNRTNALRMC